MKKLIKYISCFALILFLYFSFNKLKYAAFSNIPLFYKSDDVKSEHLNIYLTSDNNLVHLKQQNLEFLKIKCGNRTANENDLIVLKKLLIDAYVQLLTYMSLENYKNDKAKQIAYKAFFFKTAYEQNQTKILFQSYSDLISNNLAKDSVKLIDCNDTVLMKKGNTYALVVGDKVINIIVELEKLLNGYNKEYGDTKAEKNYLNSIKENKN